jgi:uncharacterized protein involved in type VI secretion and phage assembly
LVFVPEVGDQVMIGFEFGDPNRPFVMGSMFHGKNSQGGGKKNVIKSIITRSGHTIEFNDDDKSLGITIKDINGNVIYIDTKGKNIEITAQNNITLNAKEIISMNAKNISIDATESLYAKIGENIDAIINKQVKLKANDIIAYIKECVQETAKEYDLKSEKIRIDSTKENLELASSKTVDIQSSEKVQLF